MRRRHFALAPRLADAVDAAPDLACMTPVERSVVCFRFEPPGYGTTETDVDVLVDVVRKTGAHLAAA